MRYRTPPPRQSDPGGGYLVSVGDVMAGLLFVFILTALVFALQLSQATADFSQATTAAADEEAKLTIEVQRYEAADDARRNLLEQLEKALLAVHVEVDVDKERGVLRLPDKVIRFEVGDKEYRTEDEPNVRELGRVLSEVLPCFSTRASEPDCADRNPAKARLEAVFVEGHSDNQPYQGVFETNLGLSAARAQYTFEKMTGEGTEGSAGLAELRNPGEERLFGVSGYGDERPISDRHDLNRRIDLRFIMAPPERSKLAPPAEAVGKELVAP